MQGMRCRFGVNSDNELVDLNKFIEIYRYMSNIKDTKISLKKLSAESGYTFCILRKAVAYFESRGVFSYENYRNEYNNERLRSVLEAMKAGETINSIKNWNVWSRHYEFLYYRYHKEVLAYELSKIKGQKKRNPSVNKEKVEAIIKPALEAMIESDDDINIKNVCNRVHISPTALRLCGGNGIVADMKKKQAISRQKRVLDNIRTLTEKYFKSNVDTRVSSAALYKFIGIDRPTVWRMSPEMTAQLRDRILSHNILIKQKSQ